MKYNYLINIILKSIELAVPGIIRDFYEVKKLLNTKKTAKDFAAKTDLRVEKILFEALNSAKPDFGFLMEESGEVEGKCPYRWVIDPIDGSLNFSKGIPLFAVSVSVEKVYGENREVVAAVTHLPILNESYVASKEGGAFYIAETNLKTRIKCSSVENLSEALLITNKSAIDKHYELIQKIIKTGANMRMTGSMAIDFAYFASGKYDLLIEKGGKIWDYSAGQLLASESGATSIHQYKDKKLMMFANQKLFEALQEKIDI